MRFQLQSVVRAVDVVDFSTATTATQTGPAFWAEDGTLEIPFDRDLTDEERDAVSLLVTSATDSEALMRSASAAYLARTTPTTAQNTAQIKLLTRLVLHLIDQRGAPVSLTADSPQEAGVRRTA